ncbi:MAG: hypothetical protein JXA69_12390 [Phycisphaerae bacterium]|nr:hypothetical protein [Phycisphaerae bacterium]
MKRLGRTKTVVYVLLLGATGSALLIDRAFSPASAVAEEAAGARQIVSRALPDAKDTHVAAPPLAAVFQTEKGDSSAAAPAPWAVVPLRDPFTVSPKLQSLFPAHSQERQDADQQRAAEAEARRKTIDTFADRHRLVATMVAPGQASAVIDGRIMCVGEQLDGFELRAIEHYRVRFEMGESVIHLTLPEATGSQVSGPESR